MQETWTPPNMWLVFCVEIYLASVELCLIMDNEDLQLRDPDRNDAHNVYYILVSKGDVLLKFDSSVSESTGVPRY